MANILDAESSFLQAQSRVAEWKARFLAAWTEPLNEAQLVLWWSSLPPMMHQMMAQMNPEEHARLEKKVREIEERRNRNGAERG